MPRDLGESKQSNTSRSKPLTIVQYSKKEVRHWVSESRRNLLTGRSSVIVGLVASHNYISDVGQARKRHSKLSLGGC